MRLAAIIRMLVLATMLIFSYILPVTGYTGPPASSPINQTTAEIGLSSTEEGSLSTEEESTLEETITIEEEPVLPEQQPGAVEEEPAASPEEDPAVVEEETTSPQEQPPLVEEPTLPLEEVPVLVPEVPIIPEIMNDLNSAGPPTVRFRLMTLPQSPPIVANPDGSFTYTQIVDENSQPPYYTAPASGGFEVYSWYNEDYGWMHDFPDWNTSGLTILSAKLTIHAYDIDSEVSHGLNGEYDGVSVDGVMLDPGYLQGANGQWSETVFDIPLRNITDDGILNLWVDIDMNHTEQTWATTLDYSMLTITYRTDGNNPPYQPELAKMPPGAVADDKDLVVNVTGPNPADPDGDAVHYEYRWFVDVGNGFFVDDEFAGRNNHTGNTVPSSDTQEGDTWRVQVIPVDERGAIGTYSTVTWNIVRNMVAYDDSITTKPDTPVRITLNAYDVDGDPLTYIIESGPSNGTLSEIVGNTVTYQPNAGYTGADSFTFKVSDGEVDSNIATIAITITSGEPPPPPPPPTGGKSRRDRSSQEKPPEGSLIDRMPGYIQLCQPQQIKQVTEVIALEYDAKLLAENPQHKARVYYWNTKANKWVALATNLKPDGKAEGINDGGYTGWFIVFGVVQPVFTDTQGHWAEQVTDRMNGLGIIEGYPNKNSGLVREARLEQFVSRAEFTAFVTRLLNIYSDQPLLAAVTKEEAQKMLPTQFKDAAAIPGWADNSVAAAANGGLVDSRDGSFVANSPITRIEAAVMVSKALKKSPGYQAQDMAKYLDAADIPQWAQAAVAEGVIVGYPDGNLKPNEYISRSEALSVLHRLFVKGMGL